MRPLFDGDRVAIKIIGKDRRGKPRETWSKCLERGVREVAGQFIRERGIGLVIPDNAKISHRILIAKGESGKAKPGQIVVAEILDYPTHVEQATGRVVRVSGIQSKRALRPISRFSHTRIPTGWPKAVREEIKNLARRS